MKTTRQLLIAGLIQWLPLALLTLLFSGMVYVVGQQGYRSSANDPQIQMARDARNALEAGATPADLVPAQTIDIGSSLSPYLVIFDTSGHVVASSATLDGQPPIPPRGVLTSATSQADVVTWMPRPGVRSAIVVMHYTQGYVMAGRSLEVVEQREDALIQIVAVACITTLILTLAAVMLMQAVALRIRPS